MHLRVQSNITPFKYSSKIHVTASFDISRSTNTFSLVNAFFMFRYILLKFLKHIYCICWLTTHWMFYNHSNILDKILFSTCICTWLLSCCTKIKLYCFLRARVCDISFYRPSTDTISWVGQKSTRALYTLIRTFQHIRGFRWVTGGCQPFDV